jgi:hypothetical protein
MNIVLINFKRWCGLPSKQGTINVTQIVNIVKLFSAYAKDYYYRLSQDMMSQACFTNDNILKQAIYRCIYKTSQFCE